MTVVDATRIAVTRRVAAAPGKIFAVISDPRGHVAIDGSGMLVAAVDARPVAAVGDRFGMDMYLEMAGGRPLGSYRVENVITRLQGDTELEWAVGAPGRTPMGQVYGYRLEPVGGQETEVTSYCDWSAVSEKWRRRLSLPVVPVEALQRSLDNLARLVEDRGATVTSRTS
ncbi:MAG: hypothetical protein JWO49_2931 [Arthrobacter sp.]|jgi:hypothetical protein|nr:hypothetical protein [Arthrobacter sp.]